MRAAFATLAVAGLAAANPMPQAVTSAIAPAGSPPAGCYSNYDGTFLISPVNISSSSKRGVDEIGFELIETRNTKLGISLKGGILTDPQGRTGYVASNQQFQFDGPPQAGAIWTAGFSVCNNKRLALGSETTWYKCLSGDFFNLYFKSIGGQCIPSYLLTRLDTGTGQLSGGPASGVVTSTASASASGASSGASGSSSPTAGGTNGTATASGSMSGSANSTMTMTESASSSGMTTGVGGGRTNTMGGGTQTGTTTTGGGGSPTAGAASSSSSPAAAPLATLRSEMFGLAAGVLALVAL